MANLAATDKYERLTQLSLRRLIDYDRETGVFTWRERPVRSRADKAFNTMYAGRRAGTLSKQGYRQIGIRGRMYREHILAWFYVKGEWPRHDLDHRDTDKSNSRFDNLRPATVSQNGANVGRLARNTSGVKGVSLCSSTGKWRAATKARGRYHFLGRYATLEEAKRVYVEATTALHGEFARAA